jgi:flavin-dependent dehydrogenase
MRVESIVIVGGGSSGWMAAALLSNTFPDIEIALIESEIQKPIGVGESTLGHFNRFLRRLKLKDEDWMPECMATYKTSIAFKNFREGKGERFQYPFGNYDLVDYKNSVMDFFELQCEYGMEEYPPEEFAKYVNLNTLLADECRITDEIPGSSYNPSEDTAYHLDADLFGKYLRDRIAIPNGVVHLKGNVENVVKKPSGDIESIITDDGGIVSADLFVDCTGFKSLLLEQHMGSEFISFNDKLFNDRALATQIPYVDRKEEMETYTDCVAMNAGWVWNIPLWHRVGTGYVYSSKYISDVDAEDEFRRYLSERYSAQIAQNAQMRQIRIKHGKHKHAWVNNVVGVGLSFGFLEPLESTGLMTTHENLIMLCDTISRRQGFVSKFDIDSYNFSADNMIEGMKNFISIHYSLSQREDNNYWKDCVNTIDYSIPIDAPLSTINACADIQSLLNSCENSFYNQERLEGSIYIAAGLGYRPINEHLWHERVDYDTTGKLEDLKDIHARYKQDQQIMVDWVKKQPTHYQYLLEKIYGTDEFI